MDDFINQKNIRIIILACRNMINDKFSTESTEIDDNELFELVNGFVAEMHTEFENDGFNTNKLNNIVLGRVRNMLSNKPLDSEQYKQDIQISNINDANSTPSDTKLDDDLINIKLQELETRRKVIPEFSDKIEETQQKQDIHDVVYKPTPPISITVPKSKKNNFKTLMINSINRDWIKQPLRNNIKFGMSVDTNNNVFFPYCLCLPNFVKNITPYVLMNISDGAKSIYYSFTTDGNGNGNDNKWDIWKTVESPENISLSGKIWSLKLFDFINNELKLGEDNCNITQVLQNDDNTICIKHDKSIGNDIAIKLKNNKTIYTTVNASDNRTFTIQDDYDITEFINAKILNVEEQFSFIIKYCYK